MHCLALWQRLYYAVITGYLGIREIVSINRNVSRVHSVAIVLRDTLLRTPK